MSSPGPLSGVTVVDLTRVLAGPFCTMILADLGARVIKVEHPMGDDARRFGPFVAARSAYFMSINRNKESIALDLKAPDDRRRFEALLARADVLVENFRAGAMERLGYGWEALHGRYPRLIYAACSGFGHTGPYADRPAYDMVVQGMGGIMSLTGHAGGPPTRVGTSIGDLTAGLFTGIGIEAALFQRQRSGKGVKVDIAMLDCQVAILENALARYFATGEVPEPMGARHPSITPFEAYAAADGHMIIAAGNDALFRRFSETIGRPELANIPLFATNEARTRHVAALKDEIEATLKTRPCAEWLDILQRAGVPCAPINDVAAVVSDPQVNARKMIVSIRDPVAGDVKMAGNPIKITGLADPPPLAPAPELDQHRQKILSELED